MTTKILPQLLQQRLHLRAPGGQHGVHRERRARVAAYRAYYPTQSTLRDTLLRVIDNFQLQREFEDLGRDVDHVLAAVLSRLGEFRMRANFQLQVLSSLFYRNKGAYAVGKIINGFNEMPFALPILYTPRGQLAIDAALFGEDDLLMLFSFARAYFWSTWHGQFKGTVRDVEKAS